MRADYENILTPEERKQQMCRMMQISIELKLKKMDFATLKKAHAAITDISCGRV